MTPQERLEQAEIFYTRNGQPEEHDFYWLIARVRQLEDRIQCAVKYLDSTGNCIILGCEPTCHTPECQMRNDLSEVLNAGPLDVSRKSETGG